jgi:hypothetical protein|tara:strand:- start:16291 stop:16527 length:237 start_codon:yes stop_codon:yes gene_type:complete
VTEPDTELFYQLRERVSLLEQVAAGSPEARDRLTRMEVILTEQGSQISQIQAGLRKVTWAIVMAVLIQVLSGVVGANS